MRMPSYTVAELEEETGFDRRTIAYYVQEELLPRVGRRGPRTRYPRLVRDRLLFIRRVREAEEAGTVPAVSLSEFRQIFERVSPALVAGVADGRLAVTGDLVLPASTAFRLPEMRRAALRERVERLGLERESSPWYARDVGEARPELPGPAAPASEDYPLAASPAAPRRVAKRAEAARRAREDDDAELDYARSPAPEDGLAQLLSRLQEAAHRGCGDAPRSMNTWTRIDISPEIVLSVRNITEEDRELVERVRHAMREVVSAETPDRASPRGQYRPRRSDEPRRER